MWTMLLWFAVFAAVWAALGLPWRARSRVLTGAGIDATANSAQANHTAVDDLKAPAPAATPPENIRRALAAHHADDLRCPASAALSGGGRFATEFLGIPVQLPYRFQTWFDLARQRARWELEVTVWGTPTLRIVDGWDGSVSWRQVNRRTPLVWIDGDDRTTSRERAWAESLALIACWRQSKITLTESKSDSRVVIASAPDGARGVLCFNPETGYLGEVTVTRTNRASGKLLEMGLTLGPPSATTPRISRHWTSRWAGRNPHRLQSNELIEFNADVSAVDFSPPGAVRTTATRPVMTEPA